MRVGIQEKLEPSITMMTISDHHKGAIKYPTIKNDKAREIINLWYTQFKEVYHTFHYIVLSTNTITSLTDFTFFKKFQSSKISEKLIELETQANSIIGNLHKYDARELEGNELVSFLASHLAGERVNQKYFEGVELDDYIVDRDILFPAGEQYFIYEGVDKLYSSIISISSYKNKTFTPEMLNKILRLDNNLKVFQTIRKIASTSIQFMINRQIDSIKSFLKDQSLIDELEALEGAVIRDEKQMYNYSMVFQITNKDIDKIKRTIREISSIMDGYGYRVVVEKTNLENAFWETFPSFNNKTDLLRARILEGDAVATLNTLPASAQGFEKNSWGNEALTHFKNSMNGVYSFNLHPTAEEQVLGHTLFIGAPGQGKTVLALFTLLNALKYEKVNPLRALLLDKLKGMKIFCDYMEFDYTDFTEKEAKIGLNPLQLEDNEFNRSFLVQWLKVLTESFTPEDEKKINEALVQLSTIDREERNLSELKQGLGIKKNDNDITVALYNYINGSNASLFNAHKDTLEFTEQVSAFNMDRIFQSSQKDIELTLLYMLHRFREKAKNEPAPSILLVDELPNYLRNENVIKILEQQLLEIRKAEMVFVGLTQKWEQIRDSGLDLSTFAHVVIYPNTSANKDMAEYLSLTDSELEFIKTATGRKVLIKNTLNGSSVILDINMSKLGKLIKIFSGSTTDVHKMEELKKQFGEKWREEFIK